MTTTDSLRADLEGKRDRGVKQVRVTTIIGALQEIESGADPVEETAEAWRLAGERAETAEADLARANEKIESFERRERDFLRRVADVEAANADVERQRTAAREELAEVRAQLEMKSMRLLANGVVAVLRRQTGVLLGTAEVAALLGVERPRVGKWRTLGRIPEPLEDLAATPIWHRSQIEPLREEALAGRRGERRLEAEAESSTAV